MTPPDPPSGSPVVDDAAKAAQVKATSLIGRVIAGRYRIHEIIAMGGMATVFLGEHVHMRKRVAVKILHPDAENLPEMVARFENESIVGGNIEHPNVASASDFGQLEDGSYYLVLEYVRGITLHDLIRRGPVSAEQTVEIGRQVATALDALHQHGIIHRDLKPRNIMIADAPRTVVKIIDFGLAKVPLDRISTVSGDATHANQPITGTGVIFGTVAYMAPEAALGMEAVTARSDLYALGIILYEMLAGAHPFDAIEQGALFLQHRTVQPPPIAERGPGVTVPPSLEKVVMKLIEKSPSARYATAMEVFVALGDAMSTTPPPEPPAPTSAPREIAAPPASARRKPSKSGRSKKARSSGSARAATANVAAAPAVPARGGFLGSARGRVAAAAALGAVVLGVIIVAMCSSSSRSEDVDAASSATAQAPGAGAAPATATARTSAAPPAPSAPAPQARPSMVEGVDLAGWRNRLRLAPLSKDWVKGANAIVAINQIDPTALSDPDLGSAAADVASGLAFGGGPRADKVYDALQSTSGGVDVLYELAVHRANSKGAKRARDLLKKKEIVERGSAPFRIAMDLREPGCDGKEALFDRAASEGDDRALGLLWLMHSPQCNPKEGQCCFRDSAKIEEAIRALKARKQPR
jgi:serine/threonine-protein kinase